MAELVPRSAFAGHLHGAGDSAAAGVLVREETGLGIATIFARERDFDARVQAVFGISPALGYRSAGDFGFVGIGPSKWLALSRRGPPLDFHPSVFQPGSTAVTLVAHVGVTIWQCDDAPTFEVAVFRSLAGSFMHWLSRSSAEYGMAIEDAPRGS